MSVITAPSTKRPSRAALRLVKTRDISREEWLSVRRKGIGSSDAAAAIGLNPHHSMLELWMIKTGRSHLLPKSDPGDRTSPTYWGSLLEPIVAAHYTHQTGNKVRKNLQMSGFYTLEHPMIKGLCITPPILGRISIGKMVEKNGRRLPEKDDQFTITSQVQTQEGWAPHPLDAIYRKASPAEKLRAIPVTVMFSEPDLNLRASYCFFDRHAGRPLCNGNGMHCRRLTQEGAASLPCPGPESCEFGQGQCKPYGRLNVQIDEADELGTFIFRTTGYNSIRTLTARLQYYQAVSGGLLASLPLELRLRGKSTVQSHRTPIYYVDLTIREGKTLEEAIQQARELHDRRLHVGFDQGALDSIAKAGLANRLFEESDEEFGAVKEEFFATEEKDDSLGQKKGSKGLSSQIKERAAAS